MTGVLGPADGLAAARLASRIDYPSKAAGGPFAVPGTPGTWSGWNGLEAANLAALNDSHDWAALLGDLPWPEGTWVEYGPNARAAYWDGSRFTVGKAPA